MQKKIQNIYFKRHLEKNQKSKEFLSTSKKISKTKQLKKNTKMLETKLQNFIFLHYRRLLKIKKSIKIVYVFSAKLSGILTSLAFLSEMEM